MLRWICFIVLFFLILSSPTSYAAKNKKKIKTTQQTAVKEELVLFTAQGQLSNYKEAEESWNVPAPKQVGIRFQLASTKLGLITTHPVGYMLEWQAQGRYMAKEKTLTQMELTIPVIKMNTDSEGRDEKMHQTILNHTHFPNIVVKIDEKLVAQPENAENKEVPAIITLLGKEKKQTVSIRLTEEGQDLRIAGSVDLSFKDLEIPDPSIAVAKVDDKIEVQFSFLAKTQTVTDKQ